jgi:hypothetical protein
MQSLFYNNSDGNAENRYPRTFSISQASLHTAGICLHGDHQALKCMLGYYWIDGMAHIKWRLELSIRSTEDVGPIINRFCINELPTILQNRRSTPPEFQTVKRGGAKGSEGTLRESKLDEKDLVGIRFRK